MKHLLIDFENVQPQNLNKLSSKDTHIWLFLGVSHRTLPIDLVESLLQFGDRVHMIRLQKMGKNALDFYLSYYLGQITAIDPNAMIGILSRDGGYDVLVEHILNNQHAQDIVRLISLDKVQQLNNQIETDSNPILLTQPENVVKDKPISSIAPYFQAALTALRQLNAFRPTLLRNLQLNLRNYVLRDLLAEKDDDEADKIVNKIINNLKTKGLIVIDENKTVHYHMSDADILLQIKKYILNVKPKTYADFQEKVKQRATKLGLVVTENDVQAFARHLREQNDIRQNQGKIEYISEKIVYQPDEIMWQKVIAALSVAKRNCPQKLSSLQNVIKVHAKCSDVEMQQLLQHLQDKKILQLNNNKVIYSS